jgi:hypothetical protein
MLINQAFIMPEIARLRATVRATVRALIVTKAKITKAKITKAKSFGSESMYIMM